MTIEVPIGNIDLEILVDAEMDDEGEPYILESTVPTIRMHVDLPGGDPKGLALNYLRRTVEMLEKGDHE